jgi:polysaccharide export outer membrane protein
MRGLVFIVGLLISIWLAGIGFSFAFAQDALAPSNQTIEGFKKLEPTQGTKKLEPTQGEAKGGVQKIGNQREAIEKLKPKLEQTSEEAIEKKLEEEITKEPVKKEKPQEERLSKFEENLNTMFKELIRPEVIKQFGYEFFKKSVKTITPVGDDYVLGPGDTLRVYLWGDPVDLKAVPTEYIVTVSLDGTIYFPYVGIFPVSGITVKDLKTLLKNKLSGKFLNLKVDVVVEKLRKFNVYVTGFVNSPGMKTVDALDTLVDALIIAEGVSKEGSLRNIEIRRKLNNSSEEVIKVDLYDLLLKGKPIDIRLKDGDVIYVPPKGRLVGIVGEVKRPAIYELKNEEALKEIIDFAGGTIPSASEVFVRLFRYSKDGIITKEGILSDKEFLQNKLENGDLIYIGRNPGIMENAVRLSGEVYYPGFYSINETQDLKSLLIKAKPLVNAKSIVVTNVKKEQFYFILDEVINGNKNYNFTGREEVVVLNKFLEEPVYITGEVIQSKTIQFYPDITLLDVVRDIKFKEKIENLKAIVYYSKLLEEKKYIVYLYDLLIKGVGNIILKPGATVVIERREQFEKTPSVTILGEVVKPGKYEIIPGKTTLYDVLKLAGGYRDNAYPQGLIFLRESVKKLQMERLNTVLAVLEEEVLKEKSKIVIGEEVELKAGMLAMQDTLRQIEILKKKAELSLGRIALDIPPLLEDLKSSNQNIPLEDGDTIIIPSKPNYVLVMGDVYNQISLPYIKDYRLKDYLDMVGGPTKSANIKELYIIKANGRVVSSRSYGSFYLFGPSIASYKVSEGDTIVVPTELRVPTMWRPLIRDVVQIIFQAISTAVLAKRL